MMNKMVVCGVLTPTVTVDSRYNDETHTYSETFTAEIAISILSGSTLSSNNVISVNSSHIGITNNKVMKENYKIRRGNQTYTINYVNNDGRYTILYLSMDENKDA